MPKITYLLGAGASAGNIPIVNQFKEELLNFHKFIRVNDPKEKGLLPGIFYTSEQIGEVTAKINWLIHACDQHASVDTFARKLYLSRQFDDLYFLKLLTSEFIQFNQIIKGTNKRYDAFFAALLRESGDRIILPNINILSWNYDKQIEYSLSQFLNINESQTLEHEINLHPNNSNSPPKNGFSVFKLNGTVRGAIDKDSKFISPKIDLKINNSSFDEKEKQEFIQSFVKKYQRLKKMSLIHSDEPSYKDADFTTISYSWEKHQLYQTIRKNALQAIKDTEILVIIGYSFPVFNREFDMNIAKSMPKLNKVYIQNKNSIENREITGVAQRFKATYDRVFAVNKPDSIVLLDNVDEFHIPFEYSF